MSEFHVAVVPVGKIDPQEIEACLSRVAKGLRRPIELRAALPVPPGVEDRERGQFRAATLMSRLRATVPQLSPGTLIGSEDTDARAPAKPSAYLFVTDVDLFTAKTDGVFAALLRGNGIGVISVRRLREAFYRRRAEPGKQRTRLVKEILRVAGRLQDASECSHPECVLAPSRSIPDLDSKSETYCRSCSQLLFQGRVE